MRQSPARDRETARDSERQGDGQSRWTPAADGCERGREGSGRGTSVREGDRDAGKEIEMQGYGDAASEIEQQGVGGELDYHDLISAVHQIQRLRLKVHTKLMVHT